MRKPGFSPLSRRSVIAVAAAPAIAGQAPPETVRFDRKIRVVVIGLEGHASEIFRPLPQLPDVEVVAISDPNLKRMESLRRNPRLKAARHYTDWRQMLEREEFDVAGVCGPNGGRAARIIACVERDKHVIAEKPLAIELAELRQIKQAVARHKVGLSMLLPMRFSPPYRAIKQIVDAGEIGEVAQIAAQKSYQLGERPEWYRRRSTYGGTIPWIGIHMVDAMRWTSGRELTEAVSFQSRIGFPELGEMENVTATLFRLDNRGVATLRMDYLRPATAPTHGDDRLRLAGTKGVVEYQAPAGVTLMTDKSKPHVVEKLPGAGSVFVDFLESIYHAKPPALPLNDIYRVTEIVLLARESADRDRIIKLL